MKDSKIDKYQIGKVVTIIVITLFVIWLVAQVLGSCNYGEKINNGDNLTILLSFIGVIATFIVINNISQVNEIRNQIKERQEEFEESTKEALNKYKEQQNEQIQTNKLDLETQIKNVRSELSTTAKGLRTTMSRQEREYKNLEQEIIHHIILYLDDNQPLLDLINKILPSDAKTEYTIRLTNGKIIEGAKITVKENQISCYDREGKVFPSQIIESIDGIEESITTLNYLYSLFIRSSKETDETDISSVGEEMSVDDSKGSHLYEGA